MNDDDLDLSSVAADAALLDALAEGNAGADDDDALAGLASLRAAVDADLGDLVATAPASPAQASPVGAVIGLRRPTARRSSRRALAALAGAALAVSSTGVAAATYDARPGNPLYGLRTAVAGPRAEDPGVLAERLDAVQRQLRAPDAATREAAERELAEVAALLPLLEPDLRSGLDRRHAVLREQLAATTPGAAGTPPSGPPSSGPQSPPGPPSAEPGTTRTPGPRPEPTRGQPSRPAPTRPAPPPAPPSAAPGRPESAPPQERPTPERSGRPERSERPEPSERPERSEQPSPRRSQAAERSASPEPKSEREPRDRDRQGPPSASAAPASPRG